MFFVLQVTTDIIVAWSSFILQSHHIHRTGACFSHQFRQLCHHHRAVVVKVGAISIKKISFAAMLQSKEEIGGVKKIIIYYADN